jgi:hypothetical protein
MASRSKKFPDLNNDGKVTKADVLKGRGVKGFMGGGMVRGYESGGSVKVKGQGAVMKSKKCKMM